MHIWFEKSMMKGKTKEHRFYVVHDLRTDVFMAYEKALSIPRHDTATRNQTTVLPSR